MATQNKVKVDLGKLYTYQYYVTGSGQYGNHELDITSSYSGQYLSTMGKMRITWQSSLKPGEDGTILNNGLPYAGGVECDLHNAVKLGEIIAKANKRADDLAGNVTNEIERLIVGLRAIGYREAKTRDWMGEIYAIE